jgi:hypothetical protein
MREPIRDKERLTHINQAILPELEAQVTEYLSEG